MALAPGVRLGPYEIVSALGAGGMGELYEARSCRQNGSVQPLSMKRERPRNLDRPGRDGGSTKATDTRLSWQVAVRVKAK